MGKDERIQFNIPAERVNEYLFRKLNELEAHQIFIKNELLVFGGILRSKSGEEFDLDKYLADANDQIRRLKLEIAARDMNEFSC